jgi:uncharacterized protein
MSARPHPSASGLVPLNFERGLLNPVLDLTNATPVAGAILHRIVRFSRALRDVGIEANPGRVSDLVTALPYIDLSRRDDFYYSCRATLLARHDQREAFDAVFAEFWPPVRMTSDVNQEGVSGAAGEQQAPAPGEEGDPGDPQSVSKVFTNNKQDGEDSEDENQTEQKQGATTAKTSYSSDEALREKNFGEFSDAELEQARRIMEQLHHRMARRLTRRQAPAREGRRLDLRRTVRRAFTTGGETLSFARKERKIRPRPLVLICDVSGSMERYTRALLHFLHTVSHATGSQVETFVFATRLTRVTPSLKRRRVDDALDRVSEEVTDWSGGTRTGEALHHFNRVWARRVLGRGAIALIISDGWDRGDAVLLGKEMGRLRRTSYRLFWLNPLLGSPGYRPLTRGMQAALPHLDEFLPAHNLKSLEDLVNKLADLPISRSPDRRGNPKVMALLKKT